MKSIEEKAKAYDEALARANEMIKSMTNIGGVAKVDYIQHIFPELKESDDERIMGNIIATIHLYYGEPLEDEAKEMIAWLEKQGKQNLLYINDNAKEMFIKALERVEEQNKKGYKLTDCDKNSWWEDFKAYTSCIIEQKPAWSEEDEAMWAEISDLLWEGYKQSGSKFSWDDIRNCVIHKLKSLRPQKQWKPSDEQMEALKDALNDAIWQYDYKGSMIKEEVTRKHAEIIESLYKDLKKIKGE